MRCFDIDWDPIFQWLEVWDKLSPPARRHFLNEPSPSMVGVPEEGYGQDLGRVLSSGLAKRIPTGNIKPSARAEHFWRLMRHLRAFPLFDEKPTSQRLDEYVRKHYTHEENQGIRSSWNRNDWEEEEWPRAFLNQKDPRKWEANWLTEYERLGDAHRTWNWTQSRQSVKPKTWFPDDAITAAAKALVRAALDSSKPLPLVSLPGRLPANLRQFAAPALKACLRFLLLYPALRQDTLEAVISICPTVVYLRNRPPAVAPAPRPASGLLSPAFLMEDMTRLLATAAAGECRLTKSSYAPQVFKVIRDRLKEQFVHLPPWLDSRAAFEPRLNNAMTVAILFGLAKHVTGKNRAWLLEPTPKGRDWLFRQPAERLQELLMEFRKHEDGQSRFYERRPSVLPAAMELFTGDGVAFDAWPWLVSVWQEAAIEDSLPLEAFLDHHARVHPLLNSPAVTARKRPVLYSRRGMYDAPLRPRHMEEFTRALLSAIFWERLVPLGCVETVADAGGEILFRLSSAGRCFFDLEEDLHYGQPVRDAQVVVQPNFEIVFLHPNLSAEIEFTPFAERCGRDVGTVFRLTRRAIFRAASEGLTLDTVLTALEKHSSKPVPANVAAELRAWFGACRTATTRRAMLIEAGDPETAARVQKLLGAKCARLGDSLLEWSSSKLDPKLRRKLADQGIFLQS